MLPFCRKHFTVTGLHKAFIQQCYYTGIFGCTDYTSGSLKHLIHPRIFIGIIKAIFTHGIKMVLEYFSLGTDLWKSCSHNNGTNQRIIFQVNPFSKYAAHDTKSDQSSCIFKILCNRNFITLVIFFYLHIHTDFSHKIHCFTINKQIQKCFTFTFSHVGFLHEQTQAAVIAIQMFKCFIYIFQKSMGRKENHVISFFCSDNIVNITSDIYIFCFPATGIFTGNLMSYQLYLSIRRKCTFGVNFIIFCCTAQETFIILNRQKCS